MIKKNLQQPFQQIHGSQSKGLICPVSKHPIVRVVEYVHTQNAQAAEAGVALQTHKELLPGVSPHVGLKHAFVSKACVALAAPVWLLP